MLALVSPYAGDGSRSGSAPCGSLGPQRGLSPGGSAPGLPPEPREAPAWAERAHGYAGVRPGAVRTQGAWATGRTPLGRRPNGALALEA